VVNTVVMWLHMLVGPCWCMYVVVFGSRLSLLPNSVGVCMLHCSAVD